MAQTRAQPRPVEGFEESADFIARVRARIATVVVGQEIVVERLLVALFTGGHILLQGVPGVAKTLLASSLARALDLQFARVQFTIDLLPSDILGSEILDPRAQEFRVHQGPVFTNLLLADEINRAAPKVQSALLEAMQERRVTIGNRGFALPAPFLVIATQNPIEQSGTFELPEAQLDRFLLLHRLRYPEPEQELELLRRNAALGVRREEKGAVVRTEFDALSSEPVGSSAEIVAAMEAVHRVYVSETFLRHVVELVGRTRTHAAVELGASPRAGIALVKASRGRALIHGRGHVIPEDLFAVAEDALLHRLRLRYEALAAGRSAPEVLAELLRELGDTAEPNGRVPSPVLVGEES